jgi:hypothetical protein
LKKKTFQIAYLDLGNSEIHKSDALEGCV